jgi:SAM-dependent methyltransferase
MDGLAQRTRGATRASTTAMTSGDSSMYNWRVKAVLNALSRAGKAEGPLEVEDLTALGHLDQYHYLGTEACDHVIELLGLNASSKLLDVGSGIGGPSRYLSARTGCTAVGVELQPDLSEAASALTARVRGLGQRVSFVTGDVTDPSLVLPAGLDAAASFDHFISLLVNLHVPDRRALLQTCHTRLQDGGTFVIEDFVANAPLRDDEAAILRDVVKAPTVTSVADYLQELRDCGFVDLEAVDMSAPWTAWTRARAELYADSEVETVALHGRNLFEARLSFYKDIDALFGGGRVGGVRLSGRKPGAHEKALSAGRLSLASKHVGSGKDAAAGVVNVIEGGSGTVRHHEATVGRQANGHSASGSGAVLATQRIAATQLSAAQLLVGDASSQPRLPWRADSVPGLHDSLQYHFFLPGLFVAVRVFHTHSLQHHSAWAYAFDAPHLGAIELHNSEIPLSTLEGPPGLVLDGEEMRVEDGGASGVVLRLKPKADKAVSLFRETGGLAGELTIRAAQGHAYGWMPAGFESEADRPVIHRPDLQATAQWKGKELSGYGYCKRYHGIYPRHNGWRFIHGVAGASTDAVAAANGIAPDPTSAEPVSVIWTADATFGDDKYNYYKLMPNAKAGGGLLEAAAADTYNQADVGVALIGGERHSASLSELAKWSTIIGGGEGQMESKYENRLCVLTLRRGDRPPLTGLAYNERCLGTVW